MAPSTRTHNPDEEHEPSECERKGKCVGSCAASDLICPGAAQAAGRAARRALDSLYKDSKIFAEKPDFIYYEHKDIERGKKLGEGGFCVVRDVDILNGEEKGQKLAVKHLKRSVMMDPNKFQFGAADLAIEANLLAILNHKNILKLHGVAAGPVETSVASIGKESGGFFIIIDRIFYTLRRKIEIWNRASEELNGDILARMTNDFKAKRKAALMQRLEIAIQICDAMAHLHAKGIVYRDLKPENIGFDDNGDVKLFDFGLARELKDKYADGTYKLTGNTGSRRYMAPEVAKEQHYGLSVDVYSFGILLYDIASLEDPLQSYLSSKKRNTALIQQTATGGETPRLDSRHTSWYPMDLQSLMQNCWAEDPSERPTFESIKKALEHIVHNNGRSSARAPSVSAVASKSRSKTPRKLRLSTVWNSKPKATRSSQAKTSSLKLSAVPNNPISGPTFTPPLGSFKFA